ncbi:MAG: copper homeostasis protein CutC [Turicibacter sp.]
MLEIIGITVEDARRIEACGADRIELVSALTEGGLTPSYSVIEAVINAVKIPVNVMVRHHAKSFKYSDEEIELMSKDISVIKSLGANGVVLGVLDEQGGISKIQLETLLESCKGLEVTFHKAIDETDVVESVKILAKYPQVTTILSSGGTGNIMDNIENLKEMIKEANHINILIGGGLNLENVYTIKEKTHATNFHFGTAVREDKSPFGEIDCEQLKQLINILNK